MTLFPNYLYLRRSLLVNWIKTKFSGDGWACSGPLVSFALRGRAAGGEYKLRSEWA